MDFRTRKVTVDIGSSVRFSLVCEGCNCPRISLLFVVIQTLQWWVTILCWDKPTIKCLTCRSSPLSHWGVKKKKKKSSCGTEQVHNLYF